MQYEIEDLSVSNDDPNAVAPDDETIEFSRDEQTASGISNANFTHTRDRHADDVELIGSLTIGESIKIHDTSKR